MSSCVDVYCSLAKVTRDSLPDVSSPFLLDTTRDDGLGGPKQRAYDDAQSALAELLSVRSTDVVGALAEQPPTPHVPD
eukprot:770400-Prorocentrum_lima.AAC.1